VTEDTADKARELIMAAHKAHVAAIEAKQKADKPKPAAASKPSGKRARARSGNPAARAKVVA